MKRTALSLTAALTAAVLALSGCGETAPAETQEAAAPAEMVAEETETPTPEAAPEESAMPTFGDTVASDDGSVEVKVDYLGRATATEWSTAGAVEVMEFSVSITNTGDAPIEGYDVIFDGVYTGEEGTPSDEVYDTDNGWEGPAYSTIMPGRTQTVTTAFEAPEEDGLVTFAMSIGFDLAAMFEGTLTE